MIQYEITVGNVAANPANGYDIRLVKHDFAYTFTVAKLSTTGGAVIEHINNLAQVSAFVKVLTNKDRSLFSYFDEINENEAGIGNTSLKHRLIDNHDTLLTKEN